MHSLVLSTSKLQQQHTRTGLPPLRRSDWTILWDFAFSSPAPAPILPKSPCPEQRGSGLTASALVSDASGPTRTNGVWPPLRPVGEVQKNKPSTMFLPMSNPSTSSWTAWPDGSGHGWRNLFQIGGAQVHVEKKLPYIFKYNAHP